MKQQSIFDALVKLSKKNARRKPPEEAAPAAASEGPAGQRGPSAQPTREQRQSSSPDGKQKKAPSTICAQEGVASFGFFTDCSAARRVRIGQDSSSYGAW